MRLKKNFLLNFFFLFFSFFSLRNVEAQSQSTQSLLPPSQASFIVTLKLRNSLTSKQDRPLFGTNRVNARVATKAIGRRLRVKGVRQIGPKFLVVAGAKKPNSERFTALIERNPTYTLFAKPNELLFSLGLLWGYDNPGTFPGSLANVDIDLPQAYDKATATAEVVVAVMDTGVTFENRDLIDKIWTNVKDIPDNLIDDDKNGYVDDYQGFNFATMSGSPQDDQFHGTHVAGIIGAISNNGIGIPGICQSCKILPLKVLNSKGEGDGATLIEAIFYAVRIKSQGSPLKVINLSLGGSEKTESLQEAINIAHNSGILTIAAAGNDGTNNDEKPIYPSSHKNVLSVASIDPNGNLSGFSNFGANSVDIAAPGSFIWSLFPSNLLVPLDGTSMATPHVAGIAGLIFSQNPNLAPSQVESKILESSKKLSTLTNKVTSSGLACAGCAL
jgi:subtilisin family serine protease